MLKKLKEGGSGFLLVALFLSSGCTTSGYPLGLRNASILERLANEPTTEQEPPVGQPVGQPIARPIVTVALEEMVDRFGYGKAAWRSRSNLVLAHVTGNLRSLGYSVSKVTKASKVSNVGKVSKEGLEKEAPEAAEKEEEGEKESQEGVKGPRGQERRNVYRKDREASLRRLRWIDWGTAAYRPEVQFRTRFERLPVGDEAKMRQADVERLHELGAESAGGVVVVAVPYHSWVTYDSERCYVTTVEMKWLLDGEVIWYGRGHSDGEGCGVLGEEERRDDAMPSVTERQSIRLAVSRALYGRHGLR